MQPTKYIAIATRLKKQINARKFAKVPSYLLCDQPCARNRSCKQLFCKHACVKPSYTGGTLIRILNRIITCAFD